MGPLLYKCRPVYWEKYPEALRFAIGWTTIIIFSCSFLSIPFATILLLPIVWEKATSFATFFAGSLVLSMLWPQREWPFARKIGQLWYEIFDFSCNLSPEELAERVKKGNTIQYAIAMHPHGILPLQAILWTAYCDQYLRSPDGEMYGFGAAADVVAYIPFLRNIMAWLTAGSAEYSVLKNGLEKGISPAANAYGRKPRHLFILPGGIAEIFVSTPGRNAMVFKDRRGLIKLSLETGVQLIPTYVFGGSDFFHNLATHDNVFSRLSRRFRIAITYFWGRWMLPIPFSPKVTLCIGEPLEVKKWEGDGKIPSEMIEELHQKYMQAISELFERYKEAAGYAEAKLEIL